MLGRMSAKTFFWFLMTSAIALVLAGVVGLTCYGAGMFHVTLEGVAASTGSVGGNPLNRVRNEEAGALIGLFFELCLKFGDFQRFVVGQLVGEL